MTRDFDHYLLTRYSAVFRPGDVPAQEEWLRYRLGFFVDACWASVRGQQGAEFIWLVLFDDRCPEDFREDVEELAEGVFTPIWTHDVFSPTLFSRVIAEQSKAPWVLTTRLDSDDGIARDFMASVQREFAHQDGLFVDFPRGVQIDRSGSVYLYDQLSSPFLTLIEKRDPTGAWPQTVYAARHARARERGPLREVNKPPMWVQVIHGTNLLNIVVGPRISPKVVSERFELDLVYRRELSVPRLLREKAAHALRRGRLWLEHPGELTKLFEAKYWRVRGTHVRPQSATPNLTEAIKARIALSGRRGPGR